MKAIKITLIVVGVIVAVGVAGYAYRFYATASARAGLVALKEQLVEDCSKNTRSLETHDISGYLGKARSHFLIDIENKIYVMGFYTISYNEIRVLALRGTGRVVSVEVVDKSTNPYELSVFIYDESSYRTFYSSAGTACVIDN